MKSLVNIDIPTFNELKGAMGDEFMVEMVETFCVDSKQQVNVLKQALIEQDAETFTRAAHTLKSTSLTFGALNFGELAREIELLGREGKLDQATQKLPHLYEAQIKLISILRELCHD